MSTFLVSKIPAYLLRLKLTYARTGKSPQKEILDECKYCINPEIDYDNWNGGTYGHEVVLFITMATLSVVDIDTQSDICREICDDLRKVTTGIDNEWISKVRVEANDEADAEYQRAVWLTDKAPRDPATVDCWSAGHARTFVSHRDVHKVAARELSDLLATYGISCFVAHDTIKPMSEWREEILKALQTMEVMLLFLTDDFDESLWCHQEVGYALGKGVPIVSLKLGRKDPPGFVSHLQALRGKANDLICAARELFPLLGEALGQKERFDEVIVASFVNAKNFNDAIAAFDRMTETVKSVDRKLQDTIIKGFHDNDQLHNSGYLAGSANRLTRYMRKSSGQEYLIRGRVLKPMADEDDFPF